jgi:hypothetical protein
MLDEGEGEDQEYHLHLKRMLVILINQTLVFLSISLIHKLICKAAISSLSLQYRIEPLPWCKKESSEA